MFKARALGDVWEREASGGEQLASSVQANFEYGFEHGFSQGCLESALQDAA